MRWQSMYPFYFNACINTSKENGLTFSQHVIRSAMHPFNAWRAGTLVVDRNRCLSRIHRLSIDVRFLFQAINDLSIRLRLGLLAVLLGTQAVEQLTFHALLKAVLAVSIPTISVP